MRNLVWTALAAGVVLAGGGAVWASDTVRLGGAAAQNSVQGGTDSELVRYRGGYGRGYYGGGFGRGYYGGGYGRSYYGGFYGRGYYGGFHGRGYYGGLYGRGYYGGYYGRPYFSSYYYPSYYYQPTYYYSAYSYYPCAGDIMPQAVTLQQTSGSFAQAQPPMPTGSLGNGTYRYDGEPRNLVPMPGQTSPARPAPGLLPASGRLVSLPTEITGGFSPVGIPAPTVVPAQRVTYPAYGE